MQQHAERSMASVQSQTIAQLAHAASVEINVQDLKHLDASRALLPRGKRVYVSHLPRQRWSDTWLTCREVRAAGFDPIPHLPVRLVESESALAEILAACRNAGVEEILLISGDYPRASGPYSVVADVLRAGKLQEHGFARVSFAGHPEGHPSVALEEIRRAELEKASLAEQLGLEATFVTQFFFEAPPFVRWAAECRARGIGRARLIAGLSGPASIATLLKFAKRCGVGPSMRALVARPRAVTKLLSDYAPEELVNELAIAYAANPTLFDGLHFFCLGGYLKTCEWLNDLASGAIDTAS